jgi:hypothetical protein
LNIHAVEAQLFSGMELMWCNIESSVAQQSSLHMMEGIYSFFPCCASCLEAAMQGMCWIESDHYSFNVMLDASLNQILETAFNSKIISNYYMHL